MVRKGIAGKQTVCMKAAVCRGPRWFKDPREDRSGGNAVGKAGE